MSAGIGSGGPLLQTVHSSGVFSGQFVPVVVGRRRLQIAATVSPNPGEDATRSRQRLPVNVRLRRQCADFREKDLVGIERMGAHAPLDPLQLFLKDIGKVALLTAAREV